MCIRIAKALTSLPICPDSSEPLLLTFYMSTKIACIGPYSFAPCSIITSWDMVWFGTNLFYVSLLDHLKLHTYFKQNVYLLEKLLLVGILLSRYNFCVYFSFSVAVFRLT